MCIRRQTARADRGTPPDHNHRRHRLIHHQRRRHRRLNSIDLKCLKKDYLVALTRTFKVGNGVALTHMHWPVDLDLASSAGSDLFS